jgi:cyclopropane-fatty-acyl-phospholipid synthase
MPGLADLPAALARRLAASIRHGTLVVDGLGGGWKVGSGEPSAHVTVHDRRAYGALLRRGSNGFAESYVAGWWDCDDLTGLVQLLIANLAPALRALDRLGEATNGPVSLWQRLHPPSKESDRRNVRSHYDLPADLFTAMLDESMTYSCGVFERPTSTLADAQLAKLDRICSKLDLQPSDHVVEIGTGWGSFALHAARTYGCRVTTTTVSRSQYEVATQRVADAGLSNLIRVLEADYRDLEGTYDKLVSIEMIEAVDWRRHDTFLAGCGRLLRPDGLMVLQAIVIADRSYDRAKHHQDFIRRMVFPGGCIPSVTAMSDSLTRATGLRIFDLEDIGRHYAATLRCWHDNIATHWDAVPANDADEKFRRLWRLYLCYCEAAFLERHISDVQMVIAGPQFRPSLSLRPQ